MSARVLLAWLFLTAILILPQHSRGQQQPDDRAGNAQVAEVMRTFKPRGVQSDGSQPTPPMEALDSFRMREGFDIDLVASEPAISQPLFLSWDSRGRMWVIQYRQYQFPAGLKIVRYDHHLRAVFDKVPEAPPNHVRGKDRITVFEDTDGDGNYDTHKDVITGLNIATSIAHGRGGIWVLNPPYLLFYPDENGDDVPDADPEVHLSGFGLQDTHSVANSLMWGPDGWLYGANGSTTGGTVSSEATPGISFQGQCIWRYHPATKVFEIWAEGGGNTFCLDIDSKGRIFCGNNGGNTRGWYMPQGSYSRKNWGKHGPLTNPYAFGFFEPMKLVGDTRRFAQAFLVYEGGLFPRQDFHQTIIAPNSMQNLVWHSKRIRDGSTYRTEDNENLLSCDDRWFRPVYAGAGPDGGVYIADWYDTRLSHVSPTDDWHKESGRIYRIRPSGSAPAYRLGDLSKKPINDLIDLFGHPNKWIRWRCVLEIGWRGNSDKDVTKRLVELVDTKASLEALWALEQIGELTDRRAESWLTHSDAFIRTWTARMLGDSHRAIPGLIKLAETESDIQVRVQLAATAKRVDADTGLAMLANLLNFPDLEDPHQPLMIWWGIEAHASDWPAMEKFCNRPDIWNTPLMQQFVASRLMGRYAATGTKEDLERCTQLLTLASNKKSRLALLAGLNEEFQGRSMPPLPQALSDAFNEYQTSLGDNGLIVGIRQKDAAQIKAALNSLKSEQTELRLRIELARAFGSVPASAAQSTLLQLAIRSSPTPSLQRVALQSLASYSDNGIAKQIAAKFDNAISAEHSLRDTGCRTLASRRDWALVLLNEVNNWRLKSSDIPADVVQRLRAFEDAEVRQAVEKAFGKPKQISSPETAREIQRLTQLLSTGKGRADAGAAVFRTKCASCHRLFGSGQAIAPTLDNYDRANLKFWLPAIVAPNIEIREGFQSYVALTESDRVITGMIHARDNRSVTLRTAENQLVVIANEDLAELKALGTSLMPSDLLKDLSETQIRDLFAYLRKGTE